MDNEISVQKSSKQAASSFLFLQLFILLFTMIVIPVFAISGNETIMVELGSSVVMILAVIVVAKMYKKRFAIRIMHSTKGLDAKLILKASVIFIGINFLTTVVFSVLDALLSLVGYQFHVLEQVTPSEQVSMNIIIAITTMMIAPIVEEIYFRGVLLNGLKRHGVMFALIVSSFIFGFSHGSIPQGMAIFLASFVLGYLFIRTNNIVPGIIVHMINNLFAVVNLLFQDQIVIVGICTVIFTCCGLYTLYFLFKNHKQIKQYRDDHKGASVSDFFNNWQAVVALIIIVLSMLPIITKL